MKSIPVLDYTSTLTGSPLPDLVDANGTVQQGTQTYTLTDGDAPTVMYRYVRGPRSPLNATDNKAFASRLFTGTPVLYIDLVAANATLGFQPTITKRGGHGKRPFAGYHWLNRNSTAGDSFASVPVLGNLYEADYLQRK